MNVAEIVARLADKGYAESTLRAAVGHIDARPVAFDAEQTVESGRLRPPARALRLSLGDRACLALAIGHQAVVITADRASLALAPSIGLEIECIRPERPGPA